MSEPNYCNNCGKPGHLFHQCKIPITSIGIIVFRIYLGVPQYLMIRRRNTLGHIDFMRGKYSVFNKYYILNMLTQMTIDEKNLMRGGDFDALWESLWGKAAISAQYKNEESVSCEKYNALVNGILVKNDYYTLNDLIDESDKKGGMWEETEWGFPKGRRNYQEKDFECALREFSEETGYNVGNLKNVQNVMPYEEIFTGSNYKSYKHKYYLMYMDYDNTLNMENYERTEVSKMEWKSYEECIECIRDYNLEKKRLITKVNQSLKKYIVLEN